MIYIIIVIVIHIHMVSCRLTYTVHLIIYIHTHPQTSPDTTSRRSTIFDRSSHESNKDTSNKNWKKKHVNPLSL